jgi:prepilin-type N-terminal cleavage/methylation domain-containing protein
MARRHGESGITLLEILVVIAIIGIGVGATALNLAPLETPLQAGGTLLEGLFREARLGAIASTSAHRVAPVGSSRLGVQQAASCSDTTWVPVNHMGLDLPRGVTMGDTGWSVCYSSRGISADNVVVTLQHAQYGSLQIEVLLGGTTRVLE